MALMLYPWQEQLGQTLESLRYRLPNGVLVHGPRGIGTFDLVLAYARSLLCTSPQDGKPCGHCKGCQLAQAGTHPDIRYIVSEAESVPRNIPFVPPDNAPGERKNLYREILIHQPRQLADFMTLKSHEGGVRVVVVYPADQIRAEAAAALLKSLEEPPENMVFLMVTDEIDHVLPTIRSRCRLIRALPPTKAQALEWMRQQGIEHAEERLAECAGMPLSVYESDERLKLSEKLREQFVEILLKGAKATAREITDTVPKELALPAAALFFSRWAWDIACVYQGAAPRYYPQLQSAMQATLSNTDPARLYKWINSVRDVRRVADHTLTPKLIVEQLFFAYIRALA